MSGLYPDCIFAEKEIFVCQLLVERSSLHTKGSTININRFTALILFCLTGAGIVIFVLP